MVGVDRKSLCSDSDSNYFYAAILNTVNVPVLLRVVQRVDTVQNPMSESITSLSLLT